MYNQQRKRQGEDGGHSRSGSSGWGDQRSPKGTKLTEAIEEDATRHDRDLMMQPDARRMEQLGLRLDQDVKQYKEIPASTNELKPYRIRRCVSPFEFYLELAVMPEELRYSNWFPKMQQFYNDPENRNKYNVVHGQPMEGRCYVCRNYEDKMWHRVRLHHISKNQPITSLIVFYLDYCQFQEVTNLQLQELVPTFAEYPANVFRCYLQDIMPVDGSRTQFSPTACLYLNEYMKDKEFTGLVLNRSSTVIVEGLPDFIADMGIVLIENIPGTRTPRPDACTLNAMMVDMDFAVAAGVYASCYHVGKIGGYPPSFDQTDYERLFQESLDEQLSSKHQKLQDLPLDDLPGAGSSSVSHSSSAFSSLSKEATATEDSSTTKKIQSIPEEIVERLAHIRICYVMDPSFMVIHHRYREAELQAMQEAIGQQVEQLEWLSMARPGTLVACNILDFNPKGTRTDRSMWCRGVVTGVSQEGQYKILLVDYGNETQTHGQYVRSLPTYFHDIASFAVRIHLDVEGLVPDGQTGWTLQACMDFRHYASSWEDMGPVYCIYRPGHAKCYELQDFDQQIVYIHGERIWVPSPQHKRQTKHGAINAMRDHPMVHSLFVSCGVEIKYEKMVLNSLFWHFETISDILVNKKHAVCVRGDGKEKQCRLHLDIMNAATGNTIGRHPSLGISYSYSGMLLSEPMTVQRAETEWSSRTLSFNAIGKEGEIIETIIKNNFTNLN